MDPCLFPEALMSLLKTPQPPVVVDVRKRPALEADPAMLPGAVWRDPHAVAQWATELPSACSVVVYCVHGHRGEGSSFRGHPLTGPMCLCPITPSLVIAKVSAPRRRPSRSRPGRPGRPRCGCRDRRGCRATSRRPWAGPCS